MLATMPMWRRPLSTLAAVVALLAVLGSASHSRHSRHHAAPRLIRGGGAMQPALAQEHAEIAVTEMGDAASSAMPFQTQLAPFLSNVYYTAFGILLVATVGLALVTRPRSTEELPSNFSRYQWTYLLVWAAAVSADWLQGPYVYALYEAYGFNPVQIAQLFVMGFGSSMIVGTFMGVVADAWGRKRCAIAYCILYILSCMTKHSNQYWLLMIGRLLGGIATSILFSTFECWMVAEHRHRLKFNDALLRYMFGLMYFVQYLTAIVAGVVAQWSATLAPLTKLPGATTWFYGGYTAPFDLALIMLVIAIPLIAFLWEENYGDENAGRKLLQSLGMATHTLHSSTKVLLLGVVVSCFEGSMYSFVFNWTPALESSPIPPPHGLIFSAFMMACMIGSSLFTLTDPAIPPARTLLYVCCFSTFGLGLATAYIGGTAQETTTLVFLGFILFEVCVGVYFPAIGTLKSHIVPEEARAGVYNMYRVPLNAVVVGVLLSNMPLQWSFFTCCCFLGLAGLCLGPMQQKTPEM